MSAFQASAAPTGLKAAAAGTTVTLTWTADTFATHGFDVYQGTAPGQESSTPVQQEVTGTTTTVTGLQAGLTYYFKIAAVTALGVSPFSNEASATLAPAAPTGLAAAAAGAGALTLTWTASPGATSYDLFEGTSAGGEAAAQTGINSATVTLTGSRRANSISSSWRRSMRRDPRRRPPRRAEPWCRRCPRDFQPRPATPRCRSPGAPRRARRPTTSMTPSLRGRRVDARHDGPRPVRAQRHGTLERDPLLLYGRRRRCGRCLGGVSGGARHARRAGRWRRSDGLDRVGRARRDRG